MSTTNLATQVLREVAMTALHKTLGDNLNTLRGDMQGTLDEAGIERLAAKLPDGTKVGAITVSNPTPKP